MADVAGGGAMRVALVAPPWFAIPPDGYGGIENVIAVLASALIELGHQVVLIGAGEARTSADFRQTIAVPPDGTLTDSVPEIAHAAAACEILDELDVDVIHDHSLAGPLVSTGRGQAVVVTAHCAPVGNRVPLLAWISRRAALTAVSRRQQGLAPDVNWAGVVHNAIDVASFPYSERKEDFVLFLGRLARVKRVHLAIEAARAARLPLKIAGPVNDPAELDYVADELRPLLGRDADLLGPVNAREKRDLLASARCLIFPSPDLEPFGLVMIEAMACGTPVVGFRDGPAAEVLRDGITGYLADEPGELAAGLRRSADLDPALCRRHAEANFDAMLMARRYAAVYREAIGRCGATPHSAIARAR